VPIGRGIGFGDFLVGGCCRVSYIMIHFLDRFPIYYSSSIISLFYFLFSLLSSHGSPGEHMGLVSRFGIRVLLVGDRIGYRFIQIKVSNPSTMP